jgi:signal transduction histidine kinase
MAHGIRRFRNVHTILASAAGLVVLVSLALGGLGWRLLHQEEALEQQHARDALEGKANIIQTRFFSQLAEVEAALRGLNGKLDPDAAIRFGDGAVLVALKSDVQSQPPGQLIYLPAAPESLPLNEALFEDAQRLEYQSHDLPAANSALSTLASHQSLSVRLEALLRLARVQKRNGRTADALATYSKLSNEKAISPVFKVPYGVLGRLRRVELFKELHQPADSEMEAQALIASFDAGEWRIDKDNYDYYYKAALDLAGRPSVVPADTTKTAVAETVASLWEEWRQFGRSASRSLTKTFHSSGPIPVMAVANANPDRMVAVIYPGGALHHWIPDPAATGETSGVLVELIGSEGHPLLGTVPPPTSLSVVRGLSQASLPWQLEVSSSRNGPDSTFTSERRNYLILVLVAIVLMVALACYAMARGVLREAAAGQLQSDFVSAVSHEFRSPLTTLRQLTELLADGRILDEGRRRQYFSVMQKETSRLHQLVENLLDFGRMDAGRQQYRLESLDLAALVRDTVDRFQNEASSSGHVIEIASNHGLLWVEVDREAVQRVVRNLLENAVKYSPGTRTVWVETDRESRSAVIRVRDEGMGIPPEEKKRIFEKFVRGDQAKSAAIPGTGIGLAMVREIVRFHHGEVDVASEVGAGSTFIVRIPLNTMGSAEVQEPQPVQGSVQ